MVTAGCSAAVPVDPGPSATDPACAEVLVALRGLDELGDLSRRETTSQSTAAWGEPAVTLRCGVEPPGPSTDPCVDVDGVDWVVTRQAGAEPSSVYTSYGRSPAVQLRLPGDAPVGADTVLQAIGPAVAALPQDGECL